MPRQWLRRLCTLFQSRSERPPSDDNADEPLVKGVGHLESQCEIVVGLDFGTSVTKVVVRTPDLPGERAVPVDFRNVGQEDNTFLIPSQMWLTEGRVCRLSKTEAAESIADLKVGLFEHRELGPESNGESLGALDPEALATAYLALVLIRVQRWFMESQRDVIGHFTSFNWSFNLGVPSPHVGDSPQSRRFLRVGAAAWMLAEDSLGRGQDDVSLTEASACLEQAEKMQGQGGSHDQLTCDFAIVPEIVAAAVGYARSNERNDGLHMMIDVGASTMDVCSFLLGTRQGDDKYSLCTADVDFLGMVEFEGCSTGREKADLNERCSRMLRLAVRELRTEKAPYESVWTPGNALPVLLIGGGSKEAFYRDLVDGLELAIWDRFRVNNGGVTQPTLPVPNTVTHERAEFHRLAVAWGLSYRRDDIGDIIPPEQVGSVQPIKRSFKPMLTKDEM